MTLDAARISQYSLTLAILATLAAAQNRFSVSAISPKSADKPSPRSDHSAVVVNTQEGYYLLVHGGRDGQGSKSDTWTYGVNRNEWQHLQPRSVDLANDPPPPMFGSIGGYRFVTGYQTAFLYITLGTEDGVSKFHNSMWAMELQNFTWRKVLLDGDIPSPRYSAGGGLERFARYDDDTVRAELIVTHGFGRNGPLSDSFKCVFHDTDPYRATWIRIHRPISQYSIHEPHPMFRQSSAFTAKRDLVLFGGCYSSRYTGGYCPSHSAWLLSERKTETAEHDVLDVNNQRGSHDGYEYSWQRLRSGTAPRVGAAMAQALSSFNGAYESWHDMAVVYSGSQETNGIDTRQIMSSAPVTNAEIGIYSPSTASWLREEVVYIGGEVLQNDTMMIRQGASMSVVRETSDVNVESDQPTEFYLLFGGLLDNGRFTHALIRISFDPFTPSRSVAGKPRLWTRLQVHGLLMFLSFGVIMLCAVAMSRYFRGNGGKSRTLAIHIVLQCIALLIAWIAYAVARYSRRGTRAAFAHAYIGNAALVLATLQAIYPVVGFLTRWRRLGSSMTRKIVVWRLLHAVFGVVVLVLGIVNITLGVFMLTVPLLLWVHWIVYCIVIVIIVLWMELTAFSAGRPVYDVTESAVVHPGSRYLDSDVSVTAEQRDEIIKTKTSKVEFATLESENMNPSLR